MPRANLRQGRSLSSPAASDASSGDEGDGSVYFSDAEEGASCYSQFYSTSGGSYDERNFSCVLDVEILNNSSSRRASDAGSECSVEIEADEVPEVKVQVSKLVRERDCRICHLGLESNSHESGVPIELGCSCKDDLGTAHKNCAETWFKIKGNKTCEICHSIAHNVTLINEVETVEQPIEVETATAVPAISTPAAQSESRHFWQGHRFLNFLLACMIFAFRDFVSEELRVVFKISCTGGSEQGRIGYNCRCLNWCGGPLPEVVSKVEKPGRCAEFSSCFYGINGRVHREEKAAYCIIYGRPVTSAPNL
ncbi:hypothetical protein SAY86_028845 [Trapa natans]|uniref:RING-CH-type domain-containing protein n=1 Tax=Trapa natans TaxID=22666 RepID=A0AAN7R900_TRANT|nr:hypothetical protein SAY86_028845 [Trapa natans]